MRLLLIIVLLACAPCLNAQTPPPGTPELCPSLLQKDWKRAVWRVPLHIAISLPVTAATIPIPPIGKAYVRWRIRAEKRDAAKGLDTCMKATIDLYSQTALPRAILKMYGVSLR